MLVLLYLNVAVRALVISVVTTVGAVTDGILHDELFSVSSTLGSDPRDVHHGAEIDYQILEEVGILRRP